MCEPHPKIWIPILAIGLLVSPTRSKASDPVGWDTQSAARYLDARAGEWEAFRGADRGEGADKISCVSCHTSMSYALGRPVLRHVERNDRPTAHEDRLLEQVRRRVENWSGLDTKRFRLSYDFDDRKKVESWGTEAVLNALVLTRDDRGRGLTAPSAATAKALEHLWATQLKEGKEAGSWDWLDFGLRPWEAGEARYYGTTLAAIAIGTAPGYLASAPAADSRPGIESLRRYLTSHLDGQNLHNQLFALWAFASIEGSLTPAQRQQVIDKVLAAQHDNGGWSLSSMVDCRRQDGTPQETTPDGYATGLALHVLQLSGVKRDQAAVSRGLAWLRANQQPSGNWVGYSLNKRRDPKTHVGKFMSDAATAFAILALDDH
jgi:squalene-hopene/tetraprenyl-beta-curcumene cyclase